MRFMALMKAAVSSLRPEGYERLSRSPGTDFELACAVAGRGVSTLRFRCASAALISSGNSGSTAGQVSLPNPKTVYAVEVGDSTNWSRGPAISGVELEPGSVFILNLPIRFLNGALKCSVFLNQYDSAHKRIARPAASLEGDRISAVFALRRDAATYNFVLRLSGSGTIAFQPMTIEYLLPRNDVQPAMEGDAAVGERLAKRVQSLHRERKYAEARALAESLPTAWAQRDVLRLLSIFLQGDYESVAACFENGTEVVRANRTARHRYLRALSNLGRYAEVNREIGRYLKAGESPSFLAAILPFAHGLDRDVRRQLATSLLADRSLQLNAVIGCAQILLGIGDTDLADEVAKRAWRTASGRSERAEALLLRSNIAVRRQSAAEAAALLSAAFEAVKLDPVKLRDPAAPLSPQNLRAQKPARTRRASPRVSVIVPCFNSETTLSHALASLREQSHEDLEILVVNDASTDRSPDLARAAASEDARIRVLSLDANKGAYTARNTGLREARGEFVLVHDADDWAHPRKVEVLAGYLMRNSTRIGVRARMIRFSPEIGTYHHGSYIRDDVSSFTFRREQALAHAGYFDSVRAGADSEYIFRLQRLLGIDCTGQIDDLLTVKLWSPKSLSGGGIFQIDEISGAFSPIRTAYRNAYVRWHEFGQNLRLDFPLPKRPFEAPAEILP